jgi:DNA-binding transcriptional regulator YhcF (GntR family)
MKIMRNPISFALAIIFISVTHCRAQSSTSRVSYISYEEAKPIIEQLKEVAPPELRNASKQDFIRWVMQRDGQIRARLIRGDEDSLVNFMLFGTSFTRQPRITLGVLAQIANKPWQDEPDSAFFKAVSARAGDLVKAMTFGRLNERLLFAKQLIEKRGYEVKTPAGRQRTKQYLLALLERVLSEQISYARILEAARQLGDTSAEFAERSKLYSTRGLSSDTSLLPNFAIERALKQLASQGFIATKSVRRVAVIGPGLDFTDKQDGYDFYPQQTIQPFAIIDSLLRLGLADEKDLKVTTFDLSPRVNDHLRRAREQAGRGKGYTIQLPRDVQVRWKPEVVDYWSRFGQYISSPTIPVAVPHELGDLKVRAVRVHPKFVLMITPEDVNIVLQRLEVPAEQGFDLMIATNILVYYDTFEQCLAMANIERMLRPGGLLLSNNSVLELPSSSIHSIGYETVVYSDRPDEGDHIVWYQRAISK